MLPADLFQGFCDRVGGGNAGLVLVGSKFPQLNQRLDRDVECASRPLADLKCPADDECRIRRDRKPIDSFVKIELRHIGILDVRGHHLVDGFQFCGDCGFDLFRFLRATFP